MDDFGGRADTLDLVAPENPNRRDRIDRTVVHQSPEASLKDYNLDDVFSDLTRDPQGVAHMIVKGKRQQLDVMLGSNWRSVVVWSPNPGPQNDPNFIAFEPMAGITDAMNLAHKGLYKELQSIPPGGTWEASFWVKPSGF